MDPSKVSAQLEHEQKDNSYAQVSKFISIPKHEPLAAFL